MSRARRHHSGRPGGTTGSRRRPPDPSPRGPGARTRYRATWVSNAPWAPTGYGTQTAQVVRRLVADGHEIAVASNYGIEGSDTTWEGVPVFKRGNEQYSNDVVPAQHHEWWQGNTDLPPLVFTLYDVWVFKGPQWDNWPIASWVPIDHAPCPPEVLAWCAKPNVYPIAMSRFGQQMLEAAGLDSFYVPHAIEKVFRPTPSLLAPDGSTVTGYDFMGFDDSRFIVTMNAANKGVYPSRKAFAEALVAFKVFSERHDDAALYLHTDQFGTTGGINLDHLIAAVGLDPAKVHFPDQYLLRKPLGPEYLAACYTASDVLLSASKGEGFGIAVIEAQACGTPVIVSDFTAQPELVGDGWLVDGQPDWDPMQRSWWTTPSIPGIVEALEAAYARGRGRSQKAIDFAADYDADVVFDRFWRPTLEAMPR